jgi:hypothetical protein
VIIINTVTRLEYAKIVQPVVIALGLGAYTATVVIATVHPVQNAAHIYSQVVKNASIYQKHLPIATVA